MPVGFPRAVTYYHANEALLGEILDQMVEGARPEPGDVPAFTFAAIASGLETDPDKAVTVAALAVMRLAEMAEASQEAER